MFVRLVVHVHRAQLLNRVASNHLMAPKPKNKGKGRGKGKAPQEPAPAIQGEGAGLSLLPPVVKVSPWPLTPPMLST